MNFLLRFPDASAGLTDCLTLLQLHISTVAQLGISANALKKGTRQLIPVSI